MCLRFWKLWAGGANKKRKIYHCRPTNPNVKVIGDIESEIVLVVRLRWKILIIRAIACSFSVLIPSDRVSPSGCAIVTLPL